MYCWGSNPEGHFGGGFEGDSHVPIMTEKVSFSSISAGSRHAFGVTETGDLYASGANESGQLGLGSLCSLKNYTIVPLKFKVKAISCGWAHTLLLSKEGKVFVCGNGKRGQLGLTKSIVNCCEFVKIELNEKVIQIACGVWSSFVVLETGKVLFWGNFRQIKPETCWTPILLENMENVSKLAIGHKHILVLFNNKTVKAYGCNKYGQVELGELDESTIIRDIFAGWNHSALLSDSDELILIGKNDHNQLAHPDIKCKSNIIKLENESIVDVALGSDHAMLLTSKRLLIWGWNEHGILGKNHTNQLFGQPEEELEFDFKKIKRIFCGPVSCFITIKE